MFPSSSSFSGASAGLAGAEPVSTEVHLDERKMNSKEPNIFHPAPLTFPPISPFVHYPIIHLICLARTSLLRNSLEQKHHLLIHVKNDCKFLLPCLPDNQGKKGIDCIFVLTINSVL